MNLKNLVYPLAALATVMFFLAIAVPRALYISAHPDVPIASTEPVAPLLAPPQVTSAIVTSVSAPVGLRAIVPSTKSAYKRLSDGTTRLTFQFKPEDAAVVESLAKTRGETLYLSVTRGR